jgi:hypothetical protein
MAPLKSAFKLEALGRYREPGLLFGGGLLGGFLIFLVWLAFASSSDVDTSATEPEAAAAAAQKLQTGSAGVLSGITGGSKSGQARVASPAPTGGAPATAADGRAGATATAEAGAAGPAGNTPGSVSEGEAITSGLFGPAEPPSAEPAPAPAPEAPVSEPATDQ